MFQRSTLGLCRVTRVTRVLDSKYVISYRWSIDTDPLSSIVFVILSLKCIWVTTSVSYTHLTLPTNREV